MKQKKTIFLYLSLCVLFPIHVFSQITSGFIQINGDPQAHVIVQTKDGGYAIAGGVNSGHMYVVKFDSNANLQWSETIGGTGSDGAATMIVTKDSGLLLVGNTSSYGAGSQDVYVVKLNQSGNIQWTKTIGGSAYDIGTSVVQATDGGYVVSGFTCSYGLGRNNVYLIKIDTAGTVQWTKSITNSADTTIGSYQSTILSCADGGCINISTDTSGSNFLRVIKIDLSGNVKWSKELTYPSVHNGPYGSYAVELKNGNYAISTNFYNVASIALNILVTTIDSSGNVLTSGCMQSGYETCIEVAGMAATHDGGFIISGRDWQPYNIHSAGDLFAYKFDSSARLKAYFAAYGLVVNFEPVYSFGGGCIVENKNHGFALVASKTAPFNLLIVDSLYHSCVNGGDTTHGSLSPEPTSVIPITEFATIGGIINMGGTVSPGGAASIICTNTGVGIQNIPSQKNEVAMFPNPSNGKFEVTISSITNGDIVEIYNVLGEEILSQPLSTQNNNIINISSHPSGIYLYRIITDDGNMIGDGKLIIQK